MPEKPTDEPLAVLLGHTAVIVEVIFEVGKGTLYFVVGVRHTLAVLSLECEKAGHIEFYAVHCCPRPFVCKNGLRLCVSTQSDG